MGRKTLALKNYKPEDIKALFNSHEDYKIGIRLYAVYQMSLGQPSRKLEDLYNTSFKQITNWVHHFDKEGLEGLKDKPGRGRKSQLTSEQLNRIKDLLEKESPLNHGYNTNTWTGPILIEWVKKEYGISYKKAQIYNIMKSIGLSYQKARGVYSEADPEAQNEFKEVLKKTSAES